METNRKQENRGLTGGMDFSRPNDENDVVKSIFLRLEPILRMLLASVEQYKELVDSQSLQEERIIGFLRAQTKLLEALQQALISVCEQDKPPEVSAGLVILADYVLLPIIFILERQHVIPNEETDSADVSRVMLVRQSLDRMCVETAGQTLSIYVKCIGQGQGDAGAESAILSLPPKAIVRCLVACSVALPVDPSNKNEMAGPRGELDKGEECTMAVLQCIESLVSAKASADTKQQLANEICDALDGALIARMVHCCVSLLVSEVGGSVEGQRKANVALFIQCLATLQSLMDNLSIVTVWRAVFPGCFAGLYRFTLAQMRLSPSSSKGTVDSLKTLSRLLCLTLERPKKIIKEADSSNLLNEIRMLAVTPTAAPTENQSNSITSEKKEKTTEREEAMPTSSIVDMAKSFVNEVNSRLPAPLTVLMSILPVAQSPSVRLAATEFCKTILVDVGGIWTCENSKSLELKAMECCLVLLHDKDARIASSSCQALQDYQVAIGPAHWPDHLNTLVVPRIIDILEELPALSRSRREIELRARLQLIGGYLSLATNELCGSSRSKSRAKDGLVATSLAAEGVSTLIRKTLTDLFDVDFDSLQYSPSIASAAAIEDSLVVSTRQSLHLRFSFMTDETRMSAENVVRAFGRALGQKYAALLVDVCIADLLDSRSSFNHNEQSHVAWLHQWIGSVVVANEMLVGAFNLPPQTVSCNHRKVRKRRRLLNSLASSVLPVITSGPLWGFPTAVAFELNSTGNKEVIQSRFFQIDLNDNRDDARSRAPFRELDTSASALKGNASLVCSLIHLIESFIRFLEKDMESFLPVVLYPLFERASINNHSEVQRAAIQALDSIAIVCGMRNISDLVENYSDYLFGAMLNQVRTPGGHFGKQSLYPVALPAVVEVVLRNSVSSAKTTSCDRDREAGGTNILSLKQRTNISHVIEVVGAVISSFDHNLANFPPNDAYQTMVYFDLARMCDAAMCYLLRCYELIRTKTDDQCASDSNTSIQTLEKPWLNVLAPFICDKRRELSGAEEHLTPEEGFAKYHVQTREAEAGYSREVLSPVSPSEIDFVNLVLARSCFLLSSQSLKVQIVSCDSMLHGFEFLGSISNLEKSTEGNNSDTAILRSLSDSWPAVSARLSAAASSVLRREGTDAVALRSIGIKSASVYRNDVVQEAFLFRLLDLLAVLCEQSGDFMVSRLKDDVWPLFAQLLGSSVAKVTRTQNLQRGNTEKTFRTKMLLAPSDNEETQVPRMKAHSAQMDTLLAKLLEFVSRVYKSSCAQGLSEFIPLAGTMILPLLAVEDSIRAVALDTLKCLLMIDCDCLWRALLNVSGRGLPLRPLNPQMGREGPDINKCELSLEMKGALELVEFVESLPEQPLD